MAADANKLVALLAPLDGKRRAYIENVLRGMSPTGAMRLAGINTKSAGELAPVLEAARIATAGDILVTRSSLTEMLMNSYHAAATAGEQVAAVRELAKLHGLYAPARLQVKRIIEGPASAGPDRDVRQLSTEELEAMIIARRHEDVLEGELETPDEPLQIAHEG